LCGEEGAKVAISSRTRSELEETAAKMKDKGASDIFMSVANVTNQEQWNCCRQVWWH
jgi:short-subunit dehydrogenase